MLFAFVSLPPPSYHFIQDELISAIIDELHLAVACNWPSSWSLELLSNAAGLHGCDALVQSYFV